MSEAYEYLKKHNPGAERSVGLQQGIAAYLEGRLELAREILEAVLLEQPHCLDALTALGTLHVEQGEIEAAYFYFSRSVRQDPENAVLLMHVSECQRALGDDRGANETYEKAMDLFRTPALPAVEVATAPYASPDDFDAFLESIQLPPTALAAIPTPVARGTQPLWVEPWLLTGTGSLKSA